MRVLVVGDLMVVVSGRVERMPRPGENVVVGEPGVFASGVAANVALNLRALDVDVTVLSAVGIDALGDSVLRELEDGGVDTSLIVRRGDAPTAAMAVMVEPDGERTMVGTRGASANFRPGDPSDVLDALEPDWLHMSGYTWLEPVMRRRCAALAREAARRRVPGSIDLEGSGRPLPWAIAFCNRDEYVRVTRRRALKPLPGYRLVVKSGPDGSHLLADGLVTHVPVTPIETLDATGAGDAFDAAFIAASLSGLDPLEACRWGNAAGALTAAAPGPRARLSHESLRALL